MMKKQASKILILDSEPDLLERLADNRRAILSTQAVLVSSCEELERVLQTDPSGFHGIFINPATQPSAAGLIQRLLPEFPTTPVIVLQEAGATALSVVDQKLLGVRGTLTKPFTYDAALKVLSESEPKRDQAPRPNLEYIAEDDSRFIPVQADRLTFGFATFFDLYVRAKKDSYSRVLQVGEALTPEAKKDLLDKGFQQFYLRRQSVDYYLRFSDRVIKGALADPSLDRDSKIRVTLNQGQAASQFLNLCGISSESIRHASLFVENLQELISRLRLPNHPVFGEFMKHALLYEHGVTVAMITALICRQLGVSEQTGIQKYGLAAIFHDIGLPSGSTSAALLEEDTSRMTDVEIRLYQEHPEAGAKLLSEHREIPSAVVQAVRQHHERRDRKGFPYRPEAGSIIMMAEVIGAADEFIWLVKRGQPRKQESPDLALARLLDGFSEPVMTAFHKTLSS